MTSFTRIYRKSESVVFRKIGDECILVPIRQGVGDLDSIYTLNRTAARIWELLDGKRSVVEISELLAEEYDVLSEKAERDALDHLLELVRLGMVIGEATS